MKQFSVEVLSFMACPIGFGVFVLGGIEFLCWKSYFSNFSRVNFGSVECSTQAGKLHAPYLKKFLKKLIAEVELNRGDVLDELYEHYAHFMTSLKV